MGKQIGDFFAVLEMDRRPSLRRQVAWRSDCGSWLFVVMGLAFLHAQICFQIETWSNSSPFTAELGLACDQGAEFSMGERP